MIKTDFADIICLSFFWNFFLNPNHNPNQNRLRIVPEPALSFNIGIPCHPTHMSGFFYKCYEKIGEGTFGCIYRAERLSHTSPESSIVALKQYKVLSDVGKIGGGSKNQANENLSSNLPEGGDVPVDIVREYAMLQQLRDHPCIVHSQELFFYQDHSYLTMDYYPHTLLEFMKNKPDASPYTLRQVIYQLLQAIYTCHSNGILHRDIKPSNVMMSESNQVKLGDFGHALYMLDTPSQSKSLRPMHTGQDMFSPFFKPPEILMGSTCYGYSSDMWSVGTLLYTLLTGQSLLNETSPCSNLNHMMQLIQMFGNDASQFESMSHLPDYKAQMFPRCPPEGIHGLMDFIHIEDSQVRPPSSSSFSDCHQGKDYYVLLCDLIRKLLVIDPDQRLSAYDCLQHPYLHPVADSCGLHPFPLVGTSVAIFDVKEEKPWQKRWACISMDLGVPHLIQFHASWIPLIFKCIQKSMQDHGESRLLTSANSWIGAALVLLQKLTQDDDYIAPNDNWSELLWCEKTLLQFLPPHYLQGGHRRLKKE